MCFNSFVPFIDVCTNHSTNVLQMDGMLHHYLKETAQPAKGMFILMVEKKQDIWAQTFQRYVLILQDFDQSNS